MLKRLATLVAGLAPRRKGHRVGPRKVTPTLWVMTDDVRMPDPTPILRTLPPGSGLVVRYSNVEQLRALAVKLVPLCKARRIKVLLSSDWRLAQHLRADGVHLPERAASVAAPGLRLWRKTRRAFISCAAHSAPAIRKAKTYDAVILSPVFPTRSHPDRASLGLHRYAQIARMSRVPVIALGGITQKNVRTLRGTRTSGVAGISFAADLLKKV